MILNSKVLGISGWSFSYFDVNYYTVSAGITDTKGRNAFCTVEIVSGDNIQDSEIHTAIKNGLTHVGSVAVFNVIRRTTTLAYNEAEDLTLLKEKYKLRVKIV